MDRAHSLLMTELNSITQENYLSFFFISSPLMENIETASNLTFIYLSLHSWVGSVSRSGISLGQRACTCVILLYRTYTPTSNVCEHLLPHTVPGVIQLTSNWFYTNSWLTEVSLLSSSSSGSFNKYLWGATRCKGDVFLNIENKTHQWYEQKLKFTEGRLISM